MKLIKIFTFITMICLALSLIGCDVGGAIEDILGEEGGDILGSEIGGEIGGETGGNEDEDEDDGNGNGGHICSYTILMSKTDASCEKEGEAKYKCSCGKTKTETLEKLPHTEVTDPATEPTETEPGKTEGKHCSVCGAVIVKQEFVFVGNYSVPEKYDGDYAYNSLLKLDNAEKLTKLYNMIDEAADEFHKGNIDASESDKYTVAAIDYYSLGLTTDEALAVWSAYRTDRPLYYWISNNLTYTSKELNLLADAEYAKASVRASLNAKIYSGVEDFVTKGYSDSEYKTALAFHDFIILAIDYAYEADGITPEDDEWAHSIIGVFDKGTGVCESYAKTFQLLLNYCEIENVIVSGVASSGTGSEPHAWNMIKLDDGNWYWCDLTWDDTPKFAWGISYDYFCVNDTEEIAWMGTVAEDNILKSHAPSAKVDTGINYNYDLPARSTAVFDGADVMIEDTFTVGNLSYVVVGYNAVQLTAVSSDGVLNIPASVTYNNESLKVISVGPINDGCFALGSIAAYKVGIYTEQYNVTSVSIPETVIFIWDNAFNIDSLISFEVSSDNPEFTAKDGVLFTKNLNVLIKYPTAKEGKTYTLPAETTIIAAGAFTTLYSNTEDTLELEKIYLSASAVTAGVANRGYGYENSKYVEATPWNNIRAKLSGEALVYSADGSVFTED